MRRYQQISWGQRGIAGLGTWLGGGAWIAASVMIVPAADAAVLSSWTFDQATRQLSVTLPSGVTPRFLVMAEPARIILEIPNTQLGDLAPSRSYSGAVENIQAVQHDSDTVRIVVRLAPNTVIDRRHATLTSLEANGQTRWILTPLIVDGTTTASAPSTPPAGPSTAAAQSTPPAEPIPVLPSADPVPAPSASAEPLPPADQPAAPAATAPLRPPAEPPTAAPTQPEETGTPIPVIPPAPQAPVASQPLSQNADQGLSTSASNLVLPPINSGLSTLPESLPIDPFAATLNNNAQVSVPPLDESVAVAPATPSVSVPSQPDFPAADVPAAEPAPPPAPTVAVDPASPSAPSSMEALPPVAVTPTPAPKPEDRPLAVPSMPSAADADQGLPPAPTQTEDAIAAAPNSVIAFGQPLPRAGDKANEPSPTPASAESPANVLIPAGTVLSLRYPGTEPLVLNQTNEWNEVLLLETEIRDPVTQAVIAPAGSQLVGQFSPDPMGQRWTSQVLVLPPGQRLALTSASDYIVGTPQLSAGQVGLNAGIGALVLTVLTGGIGGLVGGAVMGATTAVGTAPQTITIQPNQVFEVQVVEDVSRTW